MTDTETPTCDELAGRWALKLVSAPRDSRSIDSRVEIEFDTDGKYVIRSDASEPVAGRVEPRGVRMFRTVATGISLPARALNLSGDKLTWTMSDGVDLVFTRQAGEVDA